MDAFIDDVAVGGDGGIWYVQGMASALGVLIPWDSLSVVFPLPEAAAIAAAPDESIWFADILAPPRHVGRLDLATGYCYAMDSSPGNSAAAFVCVR
jgi:streptogramin lyase